jgi:putative ABC transport system substrate-binding protein
VHQTKYLVEIGFSPGYAAWALGFVSLAGIPGQIGLGYLSDRIGREWVWAVGGLGFAICYIALLLMRESPTPALLYLMVLSQGVLGYGLTSVVGAIPAEIFQGKHYGAVFGTVMLAAVGGGAAGPWLTGALHDATGSYTLAFWIAIGMSTLSAVAIWLAADLVRSEVDVVLTAWSTPAALAAKKATTTVPVVFVGVADPVGVGLVTSLARPGGNVTGSTFLSEETVGKQLQLLKEAVPRLSRVATLSNPANPAYASMLRDIEKEGRRINVQVLRLGIQGPDDVEPTFQSAKKEKVEGLVVLRDAVLIAYRNRLVDLAAKHRLPVMYGMREFVDVGGLMSFEPSLVDLYQRAAQLVAKILKGAKPADVPVERSTKFELVINLKTAKTLGLTIPPSLLGRADQVIE